MNRIYIAAIAVLLCCHVLVVQSNEPQRRPRGRNSARKDRPSAQEGQAKQTQQLEKAAKAGRKNGGFGALLDQETIDLLLQLADEAKVNEHDGSLTNIAPSFDEGSEGITVAPTSLPTVVNDNNGKQKNSKRIGGNLKPGQMHKKVGGKPNNNGASVLKKPRGKNGKRGSN